MHESDFSLELIKSFAHYYGTKVYSKKKIQNAYTGSGEPDLHICLASVPIYIECKLFRYMFDSQKLRLRDLKEVTPTQMADLEEIHKAGGNAFIAFNYRPSRICVLWRYPFLEGFYIIMSMQTGCLWPVKTVFDNYKAIAEWLLPID